MAVAVIDLSGLVRSRSEEDKRRVASQIADACQSTGVFYIVGHELDAELEEQVFGAAKAFFALPDATKRAIPIKSGGFTRGYIGVGGESGSERLECKEAFSYGFDWDANTPPTNALQGPNQWPSAEVTPTWRNTMNEFYSRMVLVAETVARGLSLALGFDENFLGSYCKEGNTISLLRLFHYFPYASHQVAESGASPNQEKIGSSPHTDWGFLTLVLQDGSGGLQLHTNGEWVDVPPVPHSMVVNCGDYLALLSHGRVKSPLHRVCCGDTDRLSFVFFYYPSFEANIPPLVQGAELSLLRDQRDQQDKAGLPEGVSFGQYIARKWDEVFRKAA